METKFKMGDLVYYKNLPFKVIDRHKNDLGRFYALEFVGVVHEDLLREVESVGR